MQQLWQFVGLLSVHWLGDFVLQTRWQSQNKSKRVDALLRHIAIYTAILLAGSLVIFGARSFILLVCRNQWHVAFWRRFRNQSHHIAALRSGALA
jgi:hypothetical protein